MLKSATDKKQTVQVFIAAIKILSDGETLCERDWSVMHEKCLAAMKTAIKESANKINTRLENSYWTY